MSVKAIRDRIADQPKDWGKARDDKAFVGHFMLEGEALKRPPRGYDAQHPCIDDLKRKDFIGSTPLKAKDASSAKLVDQAAEAFRASAPFMRFLCQAVGVPF